MTEMVAVPELLIRGLLSLVSFVMFVLASVAFVLSRPHHQDQSLVIIILCFSSTYHKESRRAGLPLLAVGCAFALAYSTC
jgi:ABC-type uncharacterized transport system permease subunit